MIFALSASNSSMSVLYVCVLICVIYVCEFVCVNFWPLTYAASRLLSQSTLHLAMEMDYPVSLLAEPLQSVLCV